MKKPAVSVIVAVYNGRDYLKDGLDTICSQTLKNIEIICVNDGSTDNSLEILQEYARRDSRIRVVNLEHSNAGNARNRGMEYATGEYLSILDCDDFYEVNMLELAYEKAKKLDLDMLAFGCDTYENAIGRFAPNRYSIAWYYVPRKAVFTASDVRKDVFKLFVGWAWDKLFKTSFVRENNLQFQPQRSSNDLLFVFSALTLARRIAVMNSVLVHHRAAGGTLSVTREQSWHCFHDALVALRSHLVTHALFDNYQRDYVNYCLHFSLWNLNTLAQPTRDLLYEKLKREWFREFGVANHGKDYFYNKQEYLQYRWICSFQPGEKPSHYWRVRYTCRKYLEKGKRGIRYLIARALWTACGK